MKMRYRAVAPLLASALLAACGTHAGTSSAGPATDAVAAEGGRGADPGELVIDEAMLQAVAVEAVRERDLPRALSIAGKVQFDEDRVARILAPLSGQIADLHLKVGDAVRKGQSLFAINSRDAAAALGEDRKSVV